MTGSPPPAEPTITSTANPRVKAAVRLRERGERDSTGLTIVDGIRELSQALDAGVEVFEVFVADDLLRTTAARRLRDRLATATTGPTIVSAAVLTRLAFGDRTDGIVAIVRTPRPSLGGLALPPDPLIAVVEGVEKPGNLGAVLRSADGAGVDAVVVADPRTDAFNPSAIRASLGTIFVRPVVTASSAAALEWLRGHAIRIVAARVDGRADHTATDLTGPLAIVLGSEATGLSEVWGVDDVAPVRLPMLGSADSLNVSAAAAVFFYEALRQRRGGVSAAPG